MTLREIAKRDGISIATAWSRTPKGKAFFKARSVDPKFKTYMRLYMRSYIKRPLYQKKLKVYQHSEAFRASARKYYFKHKLENPNYYKASAMRYYHKNHPKAKYFLKKEKI